MKTLRIFKQAISDVFTLKYKFLTLILGTIVPFFAAHIFAYSVSKVRVELMKKEPSYFISLFAGLWAYLILYGMSIIISLKFIKELLPSVPNFFLLLPFLAIILLAHFAISQLYYSFYKENA